MIERTGEMGEPWGAPMDMSIGSDVKLLKHSWTVWLSRKELSQSQVLPAKPSRLKVQVRRVWLMLSKKPWMLN